MKLLRCARVVAASNLTRCALWPPCRTGRLFPGLHTPLKAGDVSVDDAVKVIRDEFRREVDEEDTLDNRINLAMELLRRLTAVKAHQGCATVADTNGLRVALATTFFPAASDPPKAFAFAYRLRLTNVREDGRSLQVVSRGWRFEGDDGDVVEVPRGSPGERPPRCARGRGHARSWA